MILINSFLIISLIGLFYVGITTGIWWMLTTYIIYTILFLIIFEPLFTCSHCPYYAEKRSRINCPGNIIIPKIWNYNPKPINKYEKIFTIIGFIILGAYPLFSELFGIWFFYSNGFNIHNKSFFGLIFIFISTFLICIVLFTYFLLIYCPRCINFSCYFNKVPKSIVDEYLKKNPVIRKSWEKNGYELYNNK
jgi:hypothetical protein